MLFTLGISEESMNRMKDIFWSEQMKLYFEQIMRIIPASVGTFASGEILKNIEENTRKRGVLEVSEEDLLKAVLDNTPIFYRNDLMKLLHDFGIGKENLNWKKKDGELKKIAMDIMEASSVAEVSMDQELIMRILKVYHKIFLSPETKIFFATTTKKIEHRELEVKYISNENVHNPYKMAVEHQLLVSGNHPVENLPEELAGAFPVMGYGMNFSVSSGIKYILALFSSHLPQQIEKVCGLSNIPDGIHKSRPFLSKYHVGYVSGISANFVQKTVSLHFDTKQIGDITSALIMEMLKDLEFELPKLGLTQLCNMAETMVLTYNWSVPRIQKLSFEVNPRTAQDIPKNLNIKIENFIKNVPFRSENKRYIYAISFTRKGQYMKIENNYSGNFENS